MDDRIRKTDHEIEFPLWTGEFGWELMTWIPWIRRQSRGFERVLAHCPATTWPLYADFATTTITHPDQPRGLDYPKRYRPDGEHKCYGKPNPEYDILIHARGIRRSVNKNYERFAEVAAQLSPLRLGCIGSGPDGQVDCCRDLRGIEIEQLCDLMAGCRLVVGASSGVMHLSALCGANMVTWGDRRTYFGETLEQRYKVTWNPFDVQVGWIDVDDWQPSPTQIINEIERLL